jgi:hypothetical protein
MKPYPHLYVKPVFRPDFYNCILSHIPPSAITEVGRCRMIAKKVMLKARMVSTLPL